MKLKKVSALLLAAALLIIVRAYYPTYRWARSARLRTPHLTETCKKYFHQQKDGAIRSERWSNLMTTVKPRLYYSDKFKLIVCGVPKCASTQWRKLLLVLENDLRRTSVEEIKHEESFTEAMKHRFIWHKFPNSDDEEEIDFRLNKYFRVMTVREPLQRIASAYADKMLLDGTTVEFYANLSMEIHRQYAKYPVKDGRATFNDFIQHILDTNQTENLDIHWRPYNDICDPCAMKYDYVAKLETFNFDISHLARRLGVEQKLIKGINSRKPLQQWPKKYLKYFEQIPVIDQRRIYDYYKLDYELFDYPKPPFVEEEPK